MQKPRIWALAVILLAVWPSEVTAHVPVACQAAYDAALGHAGSMVGDSSPGAKYDAAYRAWSDADEAYQDAIDAYLDRLHENGGRFPKAQSDRYLNTSEAETDALIAMLEAARDMRLAWLDGNFKWFDLLECIQKH